MAVLRGARGPITPILSRQPPLMLPVVFCQKSDDLSRTTDAVTRLSRGCNSGLVPAHATAVAVPAYAEFHHMHSSWPGLLTMAKKWSWGMTFIVRHRAHPSSSTALTCDPSERRRRLAFPSPERLCPPP